MLEFYWSAWPLVMGSIGVGDQDVVMGRCRGLEIDWADTKWEQCWGSGGWPVCPLVQQGALARVGGQDMVMRKGEPVEVGWRSTEKVGVISGQPAYLCLCWCLVSSVWQWASTRVVGQAMVTKGGGRLGVVGWAGDWGSVGDLRVGGLSGVLGSSSTWDKAGAFYPSSCYLASEDQT